jgi:endonuclease/exonuclease/phosphatase family metal-dependent hydrolase
MGYPGTFHHPLGIKSGFRFLILVLVLSANVAQAEPLRVLTQNMNRFFDDVDDGNNEKILPGERFRQRVKAAAKKFGDHFALPHIIALQEVENPRVLGEIAAEIRRRYDARYRPVLVPGQDLSGINLGYLVRYEVEIRRVDQLFRDHSLGASGNPLFARPPLYLEACFIEHCLSLLNLHLRSMRGIDSDHEGNRVRRKRLAQAETIADWSNRLQQTRPQVSLLILGDLNALTPSDRHVDVAGIIRGNPDNDSVRLAGRDLVEPDLVDLTRLVPKGKRYSFIFRRKKQQLDYMLVNQAFAADVEDIAFGPIDRRFSDHAGLQARFRW